MKKERRTRLLSNGSGAVIVRARGRFSRLRQQPGKNIGTAGSPTLVRSLLEQGLLDELILLVHPVVAGSGKRLFKDGDSLKRLNLLSAKPTRTGTLILTYQPRKA